MELEEKLIELLENTQDPQDIMEAEFNRYYDTLVEELDGFHIENLSDEMRNTYSGRIGYIAGSTNKYVMEDRSKEYIEFNVQLTEPVVTKSYDIVLIAVKIEEYNDGKEDRIHQSKLADCGCTLRLNETEVRNLGSLEDVIQICNTELSNIQKKAVYEEERYI